MRREVLLVLAVIVLAVFAALALVPGALAEKPVPSKPMAYFMHGGSSSGVCKS